MTWYCRTASNSRWLRDDGDTAVNSLANNQGHNNDVGSSNGNNFETTTNLGGDGGNYAGMNNVNLFADVNVDL